MNRVGVIAALPVEAACLTGCVISPETPFRLNNDTLVLVTGTGAERAGLGATKLIESGIRALVSWGLAGALDDALRPGDLVVPERVIQSSQTFPTSPAWRQRIHEHLLQNNFRFSSGAMTEADHILDSSVAKARLHGTTGAVAVDMESAAIAAVASNAKLDYMVIRAISDSTTTRIPDAVIKHSDRFGRPVLPAFILELVRHPGQIHQLFHLARDYNTARKKLLLLGQEIKEQLLYT